MSVSGCVFQKKEMVTNHFTDKELACKHCGVNKCTPSLISALEALRVYVGHPVLVNDAYRCPEHNSEVHGVVSSMHLKGMAADIHVDGMSARELFNVAFAKVKAFRGFGIDDHKNYIHVDVRDTFAHWCYDEFGTPCKYYDV